MGNDSHAHPYWLVIGHSFFEEPQPALLYNPLHMLMSPMFIVTKLFVTLGFRRDLAAVLSEQASDKALDTSVAKGGKARFEEQFLRIELGSESYAAYCRRVPMLVPFITPGERASRRPRANQ
jgi:protein-S-isoprenylcysteine O-methyltransferase Ste14